MAEFPTYKAPPAPTKEKVELSLEEQLDNFQKDGTYALFFAVNAKANQLAKSLNSFVLDIEAGDKSFERYLALQKGLKDTFETIAWLRAEYLKVPEEQLAEMEKKGVPLLERHAMKGSKKK